MLYYDTSRRRFTTPQRLLLLLPMLLPMLLPPPPPLPPLPPPPPPPPLLLLLRAPPPLLRVQASAVGCTVQMRGADAAVQEPIRASVSSMLVHRSRDPRAARTERRARQLPASRRASSVARFTICDCWRAAPWRTEESLRRTRDAPVDFCLVGARPGAPRATGTLTAWLSNSLCRSYPAAALPFARIGAQGRSAAVSVCSPLALPTRPCGRPWLQPRRHETLRESLRHTARRSRRPSRAA